MSDWRKLYILSARIMLRCGNVPVSMSAISTMSHCLSLVPHLVVNGVVPKVHGFHGCPQQPIVFIL